MDVQQDVSYELELLQLPWIGVSIDGHTEEIHDDFKDTAQENFSYEQGLLDWAYHGTQEQFNFIPEYVHQSFFQVLRDTDIRSIHRALDETRSEGLRLYWQLKEQILGYERSLRAEQNNGQFIPFEEDEVYTQLTGIPLEVAREYLLEHVGGNNGDQVEVQDDGREIEEPGDELSDGEGSEDELAAMQNEDKVSDSELSDEVSVDEGVEALEEVRREEVDEDVFVKSAKEVQVVVEVDEEICEDCDICCEFGLGDSWRVADKVYEEAYWFAMNQEFPMKFSDKNKAAVVREEGLVDAFAAVGRGVMSLLKDIEKDMASEVGPAKLTHSVGPLETAISGEVEVPAIVDSIAEISGHVNETFVLVKENEQEDVDLVLENVLRVSFAIRELVLSDLHPRINSRQKKTADVHHCLVDQDARRCNANKSSPLRSTLLDQGLGDCESRSRLKCAHRYENVQSGRECSELLDFGIRSGINITAKPRQCIGEIPGTNPRAFSHDNGNKSVAIVEANIEPKKKPSRWKRFWRACTNIFRKRN